MNAERARTVAEATFRRGSFDRAEEAMQEAFAAALAHWTQHGIPDNPGAWITAASHRKLIDGARRERTRREKRDLLRDGEAAAEFADAASFDEAAAGLPDDRLRLIFTCCHPALNREAQVALTLRTLGGLTSDVFARSAQPGR